LSFGGCNECGHHLTNFSVLFNYFADHFTGVGLDALRTSIDTLRARLRRFTQSSKGDVANQQMKIGGRNYALDAQILQLKSSIAKLSLLNSENTKKVKLVESVLKNQESSR
jgi:nuclear pore complex protein Nup88